MKYLGWKIFYGDGSTFHCLDGKWEDAPDGNVQCIVRYQELDRPKSNLVLRGRDYYWFDGEDFYKADNPLKMRGWVKYGKALPDEEFTKILMKAKSESWLYSQK